MSTLKVDTLQNSVGENLVFSNKNLLINGCMDIFQRSFSKSVSTDIYSTADRWRTAVTSQGVFTISRSTDVPSGQGFGYSLKWDCTTADASPAASDNIVLSQKIEGQNLQHILKGHSSNAKKLTLSFWVKSNKTGTYIINIFDDDNTRIICKSYTINSASTWEKKELTFDGDTTGTLDNDNESSLRVQWWLGAGSDFTSGTLQTTWATRVNADRAVGVVNLADSTSNEWYITGCMLQVGSKASDFPFEPFESTLRKCQRYYEKSFEYDTAVGTTTFNGAYYDEVGHTNYPRIQAHYSVRKRTRTPIALTIYNPYNGNTGQMYVYDQGANRNYSAGNTRYTYTSFSTEGQNNGFNLQRRAYGAIQYAVDCEL